MPILSQEIKTRLSYSLPVWLKEKLADKAQREEKDLSELITDALLRTYPDLNSPGGSVLSHFVRPRD